MKYALIYFMFLCTYAPVHALELPDMTIPNTMGLNLKSDNFSEEELNKLIATGIKFIRRGFYWNRVEKEKGVYDFEGYNELLDMADKNGLRVIGVLFANKKDLYETKAPFPGRAIQTDAGREGFANFAAACAEHFKGRNIYWEIWNEPNTQTFWRKGEGKSKGNSNAFADEYSDMVNAVMPKMLKADPDCFVIAGAVSNYWEPVYKWTEQCFKHKVLQSGVRAWSIHPYGVNHPEDHIAGGGGGHMRMKELIKKYAPDKDIPLINSERGFSLGKTTGGARENEGWSEGSKERAYEFQAWHYVRQYLVDLMTQTRVTIWYEWASNEHNSGFGFLNEDGQPRPVYHACQYLVKQLSGYKFNQRLPVDNGSDFVLAFNHPNGNQKIVAWTRPPEKSKPDDYVEHEILLNLATEGKYILTDVFGKVTKEVNTVDGKLPITLTGGPVYIERAP